MKPDPDKMVRAGDIAGNKDLAAMLHVKESTNANWADRREMADDKGTGYPNPIARIASGPVWDASEVREWYKAYTPQKGHKKVGWLDNHLEPEGQ